MALSLTHGKWRVLAWFANNRGGSMRECATTLGVTPGAVQQQVHLLRRLGLVAENDDKKARSVTLTAKGLSEVDSEDPCPTCRRRLSAPATPDVRARLREAVGIINDLSAPASRAQAFLDREVRR